MIAIVPAYSLVLFLASLLIPEGVDKINVEFGGESVSFERMEDGLWKAEGPNGESAIMGVRDGMLVRDLGGNIIEQALSDYIVVPTGSDFKTIKFTSGWPRHAIDVERGERKIIFHLHGPGFMEDKAVVTW